MGIIYQHLQPEERMTLASLRAQGFSLHAISQQMHRSASTFCRELARNNCPAGAMALAQRNGS